MLQEYNIHDENRRAARRRRKRIRRIRRGIVCLAVSCIVFTGGIVINKVIACGWETAEEEPDIKVERNEERQPDIRQESPMEDVVLMETSWEAEEKLQETLKKYPQTREFVESYPERSKYIGKEIDLSDEVDFDEVPLFLQWDKRWGYDLYGDELIGIAGCGPTCMSMAYTYLVQELDMNPREMSEFAYQNGYYTKDGTKWSFMEEGAELLGLRGREIGLDEVRMKRELDAGNLIICSMRPGDFTTGGHFIVICGYDEEGFVVNDPNSRENSEKRWTYDEVFWQIKCLWSIGK